MILDGKVIYTENIPDNTEFSGDHIQCIKWKHIRYRILSITCSMERYFNNLNMCGWLKKYSDKKILSSSEKWKNKFFILAIKNLYYFDKIAENSKPRTIISCDNIFSIEDVSCDGKDCLKISYVNITDDNKKKYLIINLLGIDNDKVIKDIWIRKFFSNCDLSANKKRLFRKNRSSSNAK